MRKSFYLKFTYPFKGWVLRTLFKDEVNWIGDSKRNDGEAWGFMEGYEKGWTDGRKAERMERRTVQSLKRRPCTHHHYSPSADGNSTICDYCQEILTRVVDSGEDYFQSFS